MERCHFPFLWRTFGCGGHFRIQRCHSAWLLNSVFRNKESILWSLSWWHGGLFYVSGIDWVEKHFGQGMEYFLNCFLNNVLAWRVNRFAWSGKTGQKSRYMGFSMERCHFPFLWRTFGCGGHFRIQRYHVLGVLWSLNRLYWGKYRPKISDIVSDEKQMSGGHSIEFKDKVLLGVHDMFKWVPLPCLLVEWRNHLPGQKPAKNRAIYGLFYGTLPFSVFVAHFWMWWTL